MTTRIARKPLTAQDLEAGLQNDEWLGFGYLGDRDRGGWAANDIADADQAVLAVANDLGWTPEQLFTWANSKLGRWYGDETLGSTGPGLRHPDYDAIARKYVKRPY